MRFGDEISPQGLVARLHGAFNRERPQWALWSPVAMGGGIALYFALSSEPTLVVPLILMTLGLAGLLMSALGRAPRVASLIFFLFILGFCAAFLRSAEVAAPVLEKRLGPIMLEGRVVSAEPREKGLRLLLDELKFPAYVKGIMPERVRIGGRSKAPVFSPGDQVRLRAVLLPPSGPVMPGSFDFQRWAWFKQIGAFGYSLGAPHLLAPSPTGTPTELALSGLRMRLAQRIRDAIGGESGAMGAALLTGLRGGISEPVLVAMRQSGLAHLLAISGLHMGLVAGLLFFASRAGFAAVPKLALHYPIKKWAAILAGLGALAYLFISGATIPTQRAFLMTALVLLAVLIDRTAISMRLVALAAVIVLLFAPDSLLGASFQMSFAAVIALVAVYEAGRGKFSALREAGGGDHHPSLAGLRMAGFYLGGVMITTLVASLATSPFALYHFNRIAIFGLAANMIAVPFTALWIMPWGILGFLLMPFGLEFLALKPMGWGIDLVIATAKEVSSWPGASLNVAAMADWGFALIVIGGLWLCLWRHRWRLFGLPLVILGLLSPLITMPPDVLVSGDGRLMGVRGVDDDWLLNSLKRERRTAGDWLELTGATHALAWPKSGISADGRLSCDSLGCLYRAENQIVALVKGEGALMEDCHFADVLIAPVPVRIDCSTPRVVIDRFDLWRNGAYAIWLNDQGPSGLRVENARDLRGARPWVPQRGFKKKRVAGRDGADR
ncbi:MAG: ComEC family competence protein [Rhodospirillaceae bacterium]|jgi:competence protein ComEC|nr:ComEC family competence protein [Rhodospirillaceae bacterium]